MIDKIVWENYNRYVKYRPTVKFRLRSHSTGQIFDRLKVRTFRCSHGTTLTVKNLGYLHTIPGCFSCDTSCPVYREYYTVARRYEFYIRVARTISHEWAALTREILFLPREHKIHIFELTCNILFIIKTYWWRRFWWFSEDFRPPSEDFRRFFKLSRRPDERFGTFSENFRKFTRMSEDCEDCRALSRKTRRCFDDTPTNLSTI